MTVTIFIGAFTLLAALVGSLVTWKIAKRSSSGGIDTSTAVDLWNEGGQIRGELRTDLAETKQKLDETNASLREAVAAVSSLNDEIRLARVKSDGEALALKGQIAALTAQVTDLHKAQIKTLDNQTDLAAKSDELHEEVMTKNSLSLGGLADNAETRRIVAIPKEKRTKHEQEHLDTASERLPPDLATPQERDKELP